MKNDDPLNIKFVEEIQKHECLWRYTGRLHFKRKQKDKVWKKLSIKFNEPVNILRERWRNIRTAFYASEKIKYSNKNYAKKKKPYYLSNYLQFLITVQNNMDYDNNHNIKFEMDSNENTNTILDLQQNQVNDQNSELETIGTDNSDPDVVNFDDEIYNSYMKRLYRKRKHNKSKLDKEIIDLIKNLSNNDTKDPNLLYLHSLLPDMERLTHQQNRTFRIKVLKLLDELQNES